MAVRASWILFAVLFAYTSMRGGETGVLFGWLLLVWTAPFSILWWSHRYAVAGQYMTTAAAQIVGLVATIVLAYIFWFIVLPFIWSRARAGRSTQPHQPSKPSTASNTGSYDRACCGQ